VVRIVDTASLDPPLAAVYYLDHFLQVLEAVKQRYGCLLDPAEHAHILRLMTLSQPARMLYARLVNRKGPCFRLDRLAYPEIGAMEAALTELAEKGLLMACDTGLEPDLRPRLYGCFTLAELHASLRDHGARRSWRKDELLDWLGTWPGCGAWLALLLRRHPVVRLRADDPWPFFRFLFFGELRDNLADFVTRELGYVVTESVAPEKLGRRFRTRPEAVDAYRMAVLYARFRSLREGQPAMDTLRWWQAQGVDRAGLAAGTETVDRLVDRLGRRLEREGETEAALALYATSPVAPARERRARLLLRKGHRLDALALLEAMAATPCHAEEGYAARQLLGRLTKTARRSEARNYQRLGSQILLEDAAGGVEAATLAHYARAGWHGVHSENWLWNAAFGLLLWDVIYDPDIGVFHSPLQLAPADLHDPGFYDRRRDAIENRLRLLDDTEAAFALIARHHADKDGLANPFVPWHGDLLPLIRRVIDHVPPRGLAAVLRRFAQDIKRRSRGFPDLFLWTATAYRFVEVKSENDQLSAAQYQWLRFFDEVGICVSLDNIRRGSGVRLSDPHPSAGNPGSAHPASP
jgi:hypothetical protein